jgi:hypothetical protein
MTIDTPLEKFRPVTKILADLDLLFCVTKQMGKSDEQIWVLNPINDPERPDDPELSVTIALAFHGGWLQIWSQIPIENMELDAAALLRLLGINVPVARISVIESPRRVLASAQIAETRIDLPSLRDALGLVILAARLMKAALKPPQVAPTAH